MISSSPALVGSLSKISTSMGPIITRVDRHYTLARSVATFFIDEIANTELYDGRYDAVFIPVLVLQHHPVYLL